MLKFLLSILFGLLAVIFIYNNFFSDNKKSNVSLKELNKTKIVQKNKNIIKVNNRKIVKSEKKQQFNDININRNVNKISISKKNKNNLEYNKCNYLSNNEKNFTLVLDEDLRKLTSNDEADDFINHKSIDTTLTDEELLDIEEWLKREGQIKRNYTNNKGVVVGNDFLKVLKDTDNSLSMNNVTNSSLTDKELLDIENWLIETAQLNIN